MQVNEDGFNLSAAERLFGIPAIPLWPETDIESDLGRTLAAYHSPDCNCGRPHGIGYDLNTMLQCGQHPNESMLHELTHAWQWHRDPQNATERQQADKRAYGYWDCPHEREARAAASVLHERGLRVWFPELVERPERLDRIALAFTLAGR